MEIYYSVKKKRVLYFIFRNEKNDYAPGNSLE